MSSRGTKKNLVEAGANELNNELNKTINKKNWTRATKNYKVRP